MNAAKVVIGEVQCDGGFQVRQLLAERIGQSRKSPEVHPHGEVLPLNMRSADVPGIGPSIANLGYKPPQLVLGSTYRMRRRRKVRACRFPSTHI